MIELTMSMGDDYSMQLTAATMNEMVDKIKDWQDWKDTELAFRALGKIPELIEREKNSGWYYIAD